MKNILTLIALLNLSQFCQAQETEPSNEKQAALTELIFVTGATQMAEQFSGIFTQQMTQMLQNSRPDMPARAFEIIGEEVQKVITQEVKNGTLESLFLPVYDKYFTLEEVQGLLRFYKSDIGKKSIEVLPMLTEESMQIGQSWGASLGPVIGQRVTERLAKEGIEID